jgi:hypothetical protein
MSFYDGIGSDKIVNGGAYIKKNKFGGEVYNFRDSDNNCYGYVMKRNGLLDLGRIDMNPEYNRDTMKNVTCVFVATHPKGGRRIVGWYQNATVYSSYQEYEGNDRKIMTQPKDWDYDDQVGYFATVHKKDVILLAEDERIDAPQVPNGKGGMGENNVWYADSDSGLNFREKVMEFIYDYTRNKSKEVAAEHERATQSKVDVELKKKVEVAAIKCTREFYEARGYKTKSVESENRGWDLEFTNGKIKLLVEVKGLSQSFISIRLSRNEYEKMRNNTNCYRLAVVTNCLNQNRKQTINIFSYISEKNGWYDQHGHELRIEEIVEARCELK